MKFSIANNLVIIAFITAMPLSGLAQTASPLGKLPLFFEANHGQSPSTAAFLARTADAQCAISASGMEMELRDTPGHASHLKMNFVGANLSAKIHGDAEQLGKVNYLIGDDPSQWLSGVPTFAKVRVEKIYPGVDVVFYGNNQQLEYDFNCAPGANPDVVALRFEGADKIQLNTNGELVISIGSGEIRQPQPLIYQTVNGSRHMVHGSYKMLAAQTVAFNVGDYDHSLPLVIDPVLSYSTFFGGNYGETAWAVAVSTNDGSIYIAGQTFSTQVSSNKLFTTDPGSYQPNYHGGAQAGDAFVARLDALGTNLIYLTYLGGNDDDSAYGIAVDGAGNAYVCGATFSTNFPCTNAIPDGTKIHGIFDSKVRRYPSDAIVAELNASGSNLIYSTYLGAESYEAAYGIAIDSAGDAFVTGFTYSTNFPGATNASAYQSHIGCTNNAFTFHYNAFVTEIATGGRNLNYSTYLGGTNADIGRAIAFNDNKVFVAGYTTSTNFPTPNSIPGYKFLNGSSNSINLASDAFVAAFNVSSPTNLTLLYSTYLGSTNNDLAYGIAADGSGNAYVVGSTTSPRFPNTNSYANVVTDTNLTSFLQTNLNLILATNAFLTQIKWDGTAPSIGYSTVFGGRSIDIATAVALGPDGNVFVAGQTGSTNFPDVNNITGYLRATNSGKSDAFVLALTNNASTLLYSVRLGGKDDDRAYGLAVDSLDAAYVVGQTLSTNFPILNARQTFRNGTNDTFLAKISLTDAVVPTLIIVPQGIFNASVGQRITGTMPASGLTLKWQKFPASYTLETTTNFSNPNSWVTAPWPADYSDGWFYATVPTTNGGQFFRLRKF